MTANVESPNSWKMALNCCEEISMQAKATIDHLKKAKMTTKILCICKLCSAYVNGKAVVDISQQFIFFWPAIFREILKHRSQQSEVLVCALRDVNCFYSAATM